MPAPQNGDLKVAYPYMSSGQWFLIRNKLRSSLPVSIGIDWVQAALNTSEKGAKNTLPQLRNIGIIDADGRVQDIAKALRDDEDYSEACKELREILYPAELLESYDDPNADPASVARWFMRNAGTGELSAKGQAKFYLTLLRAELPDVEDVPKRAPRKRAATTRPVKQGTEEGVGLEHASPEAQAFASSSAPAPHVAAPAPTSTRSIGPNLHIDVQIHISADASESQIESVFKSMAKHLYDRD